MPDTDTTAAAPVAPITDAKAAPRKIIISPNKETPPESDNFKKLINSFEENGWEIDNEIGLTGAVILKEGSKVSALSKEGVTSLSEEILNAWDKKHKDKVNVEEDQQVTTQSI